MDTKNLGKYYIQSEVGVVPSTSKTTGWLTSFPFPISLLMEQMPHALTNGPFSDVAHQMAYPSSLGSQDLSMRPSQDGFQM